MMTAEMGDVRAAWDGRQLSVQAGMLERVWRVSPLGLSTTVLRDVQSGVTWNKDGGAALVDWSIFALAEGDTPGTLVEAEVSSAVVDRFTSPHVLATLLFRYAYLDSHVDVRWRMMAYPGTSGIRTQLALRMGRAFGARELPTFWCGSVAERFCADIVHTRRVAAGYYLDTQHRNFDHTPLLRQEVRDGELVGCEIHDWASLLLVEKPKAALAVVKESHKAVNNAGMDTGEFVLTPGMICVTGLGYDGVGNNYDASRKFNVTETFIDAWATWLIAYDPAAPHAGATAIKRFDRARFAPQPDLDLRLKANTWGSRGSGDASRAAAEEQNVLGEIRSCADLGVDLLEIDDGWQHDPRGQAHTERPIAWRPHPERFPGGWGAVRTAAAAAGVELGIWMPGNVPEPDMLRNLQEGDFRTFKQDFMNFRTRQQLDEFTAKIRGLIEATGHRTRMNCDTTENMVRLGYFYGREYGTLFLENREQPGLTGRHVVYKPHLALRDAWQLSRYVNLNQVLLTFVDKETVPAKLSDAQRHNHGYCFGITLMGLPLLFMETQFLSDAARSELRPLIALYRRHRRAIYDGIVTPIGDEPDGKSWAGFVSHDEGSRHGYITLFRELHSTTPNRSIEISAMKGADCTWQNLLEPERGGPKPDAANGWLFSLPEPGSWAFFKYQMLDA